MQHFPNWTWLNLCCGWKTNKIGRKANFPLVVSMSLIWWWKYSWWLWAFYVLVWSPHGRIYLTPPELFAFSDCRCALNFAFMGISHWQMVYIRPRSLILGSGDVNCKLLSKIHLLFWHETGVFWSHGFIYLGRGVFSWEDFDGSNIAVLLRVGNFLLHAKSLELFDYQAVRSVVPYIAWSCGSGTLCHPDSGIL